MTAQRLMKLLALMSIAATAAAVVQWQQSGHAPSPVLLRISLAAFAGALLAGLLGQETRPRVMLRFLAAVFAVVSAVALVSDLSLASGFTALGGHLSQLAPSLVTALRQGLTQTFGAAAWDPMATTLLAIPTFVVFAILSALCGYASRRRHQISVFVN